MSALTLGQPVMIADYLVRAELRPKQAIALADLWDDMPAKVAEAVQRFRDREEKRRERDLREFRVWMPASLYPELGWDVRLLTRTHPEPVPWTGKGALAFPLGGIVTQQLQVQDGRMHYDYAEGATFIHQQSRKGYRVAYNVNRRPLLVVPSMIEDEA